MALKKTISLGIYEYMAHKSHDSNAIIYTTRGLVAKGLLTKEQAYDKIDLDFVKLHAAGDAILAYYRKVDEALVKDDFDTYYQACLDRWARFGVVKDNDHWRKHFLEQFEQFKKE